MVEETLAAHEEERQEVGGPTEEEETSAPVEARAGAGAPD